MMDESRIRNTVNVRALHFAPLWWQHGKAHVPHPMVVIGPIGTCFRERLLLVLADLQKKKENCPITAAQQGQLRQLMLQDSSFQDKWSLLSFYLGYSYIHVLTAGLWKLLLCNIRKINNIMRHIDFTQHMLSWKSQVIDLSTAKEQVWVECFRHKVNVITT